MVNSGFTQVNKLNILTYTNGRTIDIMYHDVSKTRFIVTLYNSQLILFVDAVW